MSQTPFPLLTNTSAIVVISVSQVHLSGSRTHQPPREVVTAAKFDDDANLVNDPAERLKEAGMYVGSKVRFVQAHLLMFHRIAPSVISCLVVCLSLCMLQIVCNFT
jgi:hypothetical protein